MIINKCLIQIFLFALLTLFLCNVTKAQTVHREIRTEEYRQLQKKLSHGWNTWYNNSVIAHALLPEGFSINLGIGTKDNTNYLREAYKASDFLKRPEKVMLGARADDGSYTSLKISYIDEEVYVKSATDGRDEIILITPTRMSKNYLIAEASLLWNKSGMIGMGNGSLIGQFGTKIITVHSTSKSISNAYVNSTAPRLTFVLDGEIGLYTGRKRSLAEIKNLIGAHEKEQLNRAAKYGDLSESFKAMQSILAWNTIYDAPNSRVITPVSRLWNKNWGGFVLFDWDNYFAGYMLSMFNKDLGYANIVEITKSITPEGFVPNFQSVSGYPTSSWDRSEPPVGSLVVLNVYRKYQEKWLLNEVYKELLTWNRWWVKNRIDKGYLAWGTYDPNNIAINRNESVLQSAMYESGMDNSPMYDHIPFNTQTHTMELADVGLMSMYIADCNALAKISVILGKLREADELKTRANVFTAKLNTLWDKDTGFYLNKRLDTDAFSNRISPTNFYPMLAGACTQEQAEKMVKEHYFNPEEFFGEYTMPSIARNDPAFKDNSYWRGRIWAPLNFLVYLGMRNYQVNDAKADLIKKSGSLFMKNWNETGGIFENYNSVTGQGNDVQNADGFYHWGALLTFMDFIERGYMDKKQIPANTK